MAALAAARRVTRAHVCRAACACALAGACASPWAAPAPASSHVSHAPGCHGAEDAATDRLMARVRREHLYESWTKQECLQYFIDGCTAKVVEITLHEDHRAACGGDPGTSPRVDSFRVHLHGGRIDWYNLPNDAWRPFDKIHSEGGR